jgi:putative peptidoglycan lipid II flippase
MNRSGRLLGSLTTLLSGVVVSKVFGLVRELLLAFAFGTTYVADSFRIALSAVLIPTHLLTGEALFAAFVPSYKRLSGPARVDLVRAVSTAILLFGSLITVLLLLAAPLLVDVMAPGFDRQAAELTAGLIRVAAVGVVLYAVSSLFINIQIAHEEYLTYSARPAVQNVGILAAVLAAYIWQAPILLGLGFVLAFLLMTVWSLSQVASSPLPLREALRPSLKWPRASSFDFLRAVGHLSFFVIVVQLSAVIDRVVASLTGEGGVAAVEYAFFITDSVRVLIAVPLATLVLGRLGGVEWRVAKEAAMRMLGPLLVFTLALSLFFYGTAYDVIDLLYRRGEFQATSTRLTSYALQGFALGTWASTSAYVLQRVFNATLRNREVALAGSAGLMVNMVLDFLLYRPLGVFGIALATSISSFVVLAILLHRADFGLGQLVRVAVPMLGLLIIVPVLQNVPGRGWLSVTLASALTMLLTALACLVWPPLRRDMDWLLKRLFSARAGS